MDTYNAAGVLYFGLGTLFSLLSFLFIEYFRLVCFRAPENLPNNRYTDVLCLDHSRVRLTSGTCDYINANFVDGYMHSRAFISTQGAVNCSPFIAICRCSFVFTFVFVVARRSPPAHVRSFLEDGVGTAGVVGRHDDAHG